MTDDKSKTPGMAEVSVEFEHEPPAEEAERKARAKAQDEIDAVLAKLQPCGNAETQIEYTHRKLLLLREAMPRGLPSDEFAEWVDAHDKIEEAIGHLRSWSFDDVKAKLAVLCDRLREDGNNSDLLIAQAAWTDLQRLVRSAASRDLERMARGSEAVEKSSQVESLHAAWQTIQQAADGVMKGDAADDEKEEAYHRDEDAYNRFLAAPAQTFRGLLLKLQAWAELEKDNLVSPIDASTSTDELGPSGAAALSALRDLERLTGTALSEDPVTLLGRRWDEVMTQRAQLKDPDSEDLKHPDVLEDERLHDAKLNIEDSIAETPTRTAAGVAVKLRQIERDDQKFDGNSSWRPEAFRTALEALAHIAGKERS